MNSRYLYITLLAFMPLAFTGCADDAVPTGAEHGVPFSLSVTGDVRTDSRGAVTTGYMPSGAQLGVRLVKSGTTDLYLPSTGNLKFTHSSADYGSWSASTTTYLNASLATAYAYYPYSADVTDLTAIPVSSGTTDYMYGRSVLDVHDGHPGALVEMHHALSAIRLSAQLGTAAAMGISSVTIEGAGYHATATLNACTGAVTGGSGNSPLTVSYDTPLALTAAAQHIDFLLIPTGVAEPLVITVTDASGQVQTLTTEAVQLACNTLHTIQLTADYGGTLTLGAVSGSGWTYTDDGDLVITVGDYTVTCGGETGGMAFSCVTGGDGTVTVVAVPVTGGDVIGDVICSGGAGCTQTRGYNGAVTVILTGITSDVTLTFGWAGGQ